MGNIPNWNIALNVLDSTKPVKFYDFDVVTYVVYTSKSLKARQMRKYIADSIDEKFNKDAGFTKQDTQIVFQEAGQNIKNLETKAHDEIKSAIESKTEEDFEIHIADSNKYSREAWSRDKELKNAVACIDALERKTDLNNHGILTETSKQSVFLPKAQAKQLTAVWRRKNGGNIEFRL